MPRALKFDLVIPHTSLEEASKIVVKIPRTSGKKQPVVFEKLIVDTNDAITDLNFPNDVLNQKLKISVDTETTGLRVWFDDAPWMISMADPEGNSWCCLWAVNPFTRTVLFQKDEAWQYLKSIVENSLITKEYFNAKFDIRMLRKIGIYHAGPYEEVALKARVYNTDEFGYKLKPLSRKYCGLTSDEETELKKLIQKCQRIAKKVGWKTYSEVLLETTNSQAKSDKAAPDYWLCMYAHLLPGITKDEADRARYLAEEYCRKDTMRTSVLSSFYDEEFADDDSMVKTYKQELDLMELVIEMEDTGIRTFKEVAIAEKQNCEKQQKILLEELKKDSKNPDFNPDSPSMVADLLFSPKPLGLGLPSTERTATGQCKTGYKEIEKYSYQPVVQKIFDCKALGKAVTLFFDKYIDNLVEENGYHIIHPEVNQGNTKTFRFCIAKGTKIEVVRDLSKYPDGIPIEQVKCGDWAYSFDDNHKLVLNKVVNTWHTGKKKIIRIHWRSWKSDKEGHLDCTPDHKIRVFDGGYVEAQYLKPKDRVIAMMRNINNYGYSCLYVTKNYWKHLDSRFVVEQITGKNLAGYQVHHKDGNKLNNLPENLEVLDAQTHLLQHEFFGVNHPRSLNLTKEWIIEQLIKAKGKPTKVCKKFNLDYTTFKKYCKVLEVEFTEIAKMFDGNGDLIDETWVVNTRLLLKKYGYEEGLRKVGIGSRRWRQIQSENNHIITSIEYLEIEEEVYDLEIENTHNFIASQICVHNSMSNPNLQQAANPETSARGADVIQVRNAFGPRPGYSWWMFDYSGQELRLLGGLMNIARILKAVENGEDIPTVLGNETWGGRNNQAAVLQAIDSLEFNQSKPSSEDVAKFWKKIGFLSFENTDQTSKILFASNVLKDFNYDIVKLEKAVSKKTVRTRTKMCLYGKAYGAGVNGVVGLLRCQPEQAKDWLRALDTRFPEMKRKASQWMNQAAKDGYITNAYGRKLTVDPSRPYVATNYRIQGTAADMMKISMYNCWKFLKSIGIDGRIVLTVHDELIFEIRNDHSYVWVLKELKRLMEDHEEVVNIPMSVSLSKVSYSWDKEQDFDHLFKVA